MEITSSLREEKWEDLENLSWETVGEYNWKSLEVVNTAEKGAVFGAIQSFSFKDIKKYVWKDLRNFDTVFYFGNEEIALQTNENISNQFSKKAANSFSVGELKIKSFDKHNNLNVIELIDNYAKNINALRMEKTAVLDTFEKKITMIRNFAENMVARGGLVKSPFKNSLEKLNTTETTFKDVVKTTKEIVKAHELFERSFLAIKMLAETMVANEEVSRKTISFRHPAETLIANENAVKAIGKIKAVLIKTLENYLKTTVLVKDERLKTVDDYNRTFSAIRSEIEKIYVEEILKKEVSLLRFDGINLKDVLIQAVDSVLSDILIFNKVLDKKAFAERMQKPINYTGFQDFNVGNFEYEKALIRLVLTSGMTQSKAFMNNVVHNVDIEDIVDKGTVTITDTTIATKVYYNKFYYTAPHVQITLKAGNSSEVGAYPNLVSTDLEDGVGRYFEVEILNNANERITGTVAWLSTGY